MRVLRWLDLGNWFIIVNDIQWEDAKRGRFVSYLSDIQGEREKNVDS